MVETQFPHKVHSMVHRDHDWSDKVANLRSDRGGEYLSTEFKSFCIQKGIHQQLTTADTPHQNGISERKNRTLLEATRCVFNSHKFPRHLWTECLKAVNFVLNCSGTRALNLMTPYEKLLGTPPDLSLLRVLGSTAYAHIPRTQHTKLQAKAFRCVFVGYNEALKAYRMWDPEKRKVFVSNDVTILEHILGKFASDDPFVDLFTYLDGEDAPPVLPSSPLPEGELPVPLPNFELPSPVSSSNSFGTRVLLALCCLICPEGIHIAWPEIVFHLILTPLTCLVTVIQMLTNLIW
jgi:hypothetical protein